MLAVKGMGYYINIHHEPINGFNIRYEISVEAGGFHSYKALTMLWYYAQPTKGYAISCRENIWQSRGALLQTWIYFNPSADI